jgi:hypothetical protein
MSLVQLLDPIIEEVSLILGSQGLGSNCLDFSIRHGVDDNRREDLFDSANYVALNDLSGNISNESLLRYLKMEDDVSKRLFKRRVRGGGGSMS